MERKERLLFRALLAVGLLAVSVSSCAVGGISPGPEAARIEVAAVKGVSPEYAGAGGTVEYNRTGSTLQFTLKAHGLAPGEHYQVLTCSDVIGAATADGDGRVSTWGSGSAVSIGISPKDYFELRRVRDGYTILKSGAHGFEVSR